MKSNHGRFVIRKSDELQARSEGRRLRNCVPQAGLGGSPTFTQTRRTRFPERAEAHARLQDRQKHTPAHSQAARPVRRRSFRTEAVICARYNLRAQQRNRLVNAALKAIQRRIQRVQRFSWNLGRVVGVSAPAAENRLLGQHGKREGSQQQGGKRQKSKKLFYDESSFQSLGLTGLYVHFYFVHPLDDRKKGKVPSF